MFRSMISIEHTKTMKQTILWVELVIIALIVGGLMALMFGVSQIDFGAMVPAEERAEMDAMAAVATWPGAFANALSLAGGNGLGAVFVIILTGALVAQEFQHKTLHLWLSRGVPRVTYTLARFLSLLAPMLLLILSALAMSALVSLFLALVSGGSLRLDQLDLPQLLLSVLRTAYTMLPYAALAFLLAVVSRSAVVAIGVGLSYTMLAESLLVQLMGLIGGAAAAAIKFLPGIMASVVMAENQALTRGAAALEEGSLGLATLPPWASALGIGLYTALFVALAAWSLYKQDLTA